MVATKGSLTVALDVTVTEDLVMEGNARELINRIQRIRKDSGFELTDRVFVKFANCQSLEQSIKQYYSYICAEILADGLEIVPELKEGIEVDVNDLILRITVEKRVIS
ncbi:MAG: DUF5915 domain-containing protein, partial [Chitinophagaceae bacterium]